MTPSRIEPKTLKGFRDFLPEAMIPRQRLLERVTAVYESYGFAPIDTPVLEYLEILNGKGGDETDRQLYQFSDSGGRKVGMRFDLTVPFARFSAQHLATLGRPFKRYHLAKVWRGENTQAGRYREFMQCDFDTIGTESDMADIETALILNDIMERIDLTSDSPFADFKIHLNSRKILTGLLESLGLAEHTVPVLRALDKLGKIGEDKVVEEMATTAQATAEQSNKLLEMVAASEKSPSERLNALKRQLAGSKTGLEGIETLRGIFSAAKAVGIPNGRFVLDLSIARGLDYYTGTIYETFLTEYPTLGSVASGGRYDNLAGLFTKEKLPGVGASLGIDRLFAGLEALGKIPRCSSTVEVLIPQIDATLTRDYLQLAAMLRKKGENGIGGLGVEIYPDVKKIGVQLKYADKKGIKFVILLGGGEKGRGVVGLKNLATGEQIELKIAELADYLRTELSPKADR